ncbi:MutL C terminal dimerization domain-containing protein [Gymnopilus junonius]|uniref:MutL C terminal dimerization domain-containing protein n=1 Tax=Gymnopilus junonius TaxID=109634 RepID=A0A9P5NF22_GYMJU|nr:MutL C terminal dimerization domain-containing protein [Gymnopilus junonius]
MPETPERRLPSKSLAIDKPSTTTSSTDAFPLFLDDDDDTDDPASVLNQVRATSKSPTKITRKDVHCPEIVKTDKDGGDIILKVDVDRIKDVWLTKEKHHRDRGRSGVDKKTVQNEAEEEVQPSVSVDAGISNTEDDASAVDALARVIEKKDFAEMDVVGQFNLGFIVVRRRQSHSVVVGGGDDNLDSGPGSVEADAALDDLFIVDQHAADEKYNFETLQATTKIQSQKLFKPRSLELTASDEMTAVENIEVLRQNGFEVEIEEEDSDGHGSRLKLTAQPVSKSTVFDMKDLEEIIHLLRDRPSGQMVRCSKARSMFASRACRKSVMIGMPLNQQQMTTVIRHMGTMDQPWNCPHGRPTMRHLIDIKTAGSTLKDPVDWSSIC